MLAQLLFVVIAGLAIGSVYALMALAINLVFSARRVVNFAQGDVTMLAGLAGLALIAGWAAPHTLGLVAAAFIAAAVSLAIEGFAVRPLAADEEDSIVAVAIILSNGLLLWFGAEARQFPSLLSGRPVTWAGVRFVPDQVVAIVAVALFMAKFHYLHNHPIHGKARCSPRMPVGRTPLTLAS